MATVFTALSGNCVLLIVALFQKLVLLLLRAGGRIFGSLGRLYVYTAVSATDVLSAAVTLLT